MNSFLKEGFILYTEIKQGKNSHLFFQSCNSYNKSNIKRACFLISFGERYYPLTSVTDLVTGEMIPCSGLKLHCAQCKH